MRKFVFSLLVAAVLTACADPKGADTFTTSGVLSGSILTQADCGKAPDTSVWVVVDGQGECLRYYHSGLGDGTQTVQVFFHGDWMWQWRDGRAKVPNGYSERANLPALQGRADKYGSSTGQPFIYFARPGVFGSSGVHKRRRLPRESAIITAALDAIKDRHGIERFAVSGQSGGGHVVAALLTRRDDIDCAVMASGVVSVRQRSQLRGWGNRDITGFTEYLDPITRIDQIPADPDRRIFVVGDPEDSNTPFESQKSFFDAVASAGHDASLVKAKGRGRSRHGLGEIGIAIAGACMSGQSTSDIVQKYSTL